MKIHASYELTTCSLYQSLVIEPTVCIVVNGESF